MKSSLRGLPMLALLTPMLLAAALATWRALQGTGARSVPLAPRLVAALGDVRALPRLAPGALDLGRIEPGSNHELAFLWRNPGGRGARVLGTRVGCGCAAWIDPPDVLAAGAVGRLLARLDAPLEPGPLDVPLRLVTDAPPPADVLTVRVSAYVGDRLVVRPVALDLGRRSSGTRVVARFEVHLPPGSSGPLETELYAWPGRVEEVPAARHDQRGSDLLLETSVEGPAGPCVGTLAVRAPGGGMASVALRMLVVWQEPTSTR